MAKSKAKGDQPKKTNGDGPPPEAPAGARSRA